LSPSKYNSGTVSLGLAASSLTAAQSTILARLDYFFSPLSDSSYVALLSAFRPQTIDDITNLDNCPYLVMI
jgi:hypothetical protein